MAEIPADRLRKRRDACMFEVERELGLPRSASALTSAGHLVEVALVLLEQEERGVEVYHL